MGVVERAGNQGFVGVLLSVEPWVCPCANKWFYCRDLKLGLLGTEVKKKRRFVRRSTAEVRSTLLKLRRFVPRK